MRSVARRVVCRWHELSARKIRGVGPFRRLMSSLCAQVSFTAGIAVGWMLNRWARTKFIRVVKRIEGAYAGRVLAAAKCVHF